jgi:hypothetical protein
MKSLLRHLEVIGMCFRMAFDKEFIAEAQTEQAQEQWERDNKVLAYQK